MPKKHATEHEDAPERTLCGEAVDEVQIDNCAPDCGRCLRVIRSRCFAHNLKRCRCHTGNIG